MRKLVLAAAAFAVSSPTGLYALGLGEIKLHSALNQPLSAEITLLSVRKQDLPSLRVTLAPEAAFGRAGIDRPHYLNKLKFELLPSEGGSATVRVTSREPIREPFLNFIVEADWANGSLLREYTLLLDPPELMSSAPAVVEAPRASAPAVKSAAADEERLPPPGSKVTSFGPTRANYTLWRIALRLRPDESITVQQMMLALLRANPEAFNGGNVNGLKAGYVLRVPGEEEARRLSAARAIAEVKRQHGDWKRYVAGGGLRSDAAPIQRGGAPAPARPVETAGELKLTSSKRAAEPVPGAGGVAEEAPAEVLRDELAVASEAAASRERENEELLVRIDELEGQIGDLNSLLSMKNEQLALLQKRLGEEGAGEMASPVEGAAEAPAEGAAEPVTAAEEASAEPAAGEVAAEGAPAMADGMAAEDAPAAADGVSAEGVPAVDGEMAEGEAPAEAMAVAGDDLALLADGAADPRQRVEAATRLGASGNPDAVAPLIAVLASDEQWTARRAAAEALGNLGGEQAVDALLPALSGDSEPMVRREAALALGRIKDPRAIGPLEEALADEATVELEVDGKLEPRLVVSEAAEEALIAIDMAAQSTKTEMPPAEAPVAPAAEGPAAEPPAPRPAPVVRAPAPPPAPEPAAFVIPFLEIAVPLEIGAILGDPLLLGGGLGVVLLVVVGLVLVARRRRGAAADEVPDEVAAASVAAAIGDDREPAEKAEGDPIAEADVYLDIGQYQKAEDLLKGAIAAEPARHDLKVKLLEIYFAAKSVGPFEALAGQLHSDLGGGESPVWNRVREMGAQLAPSHPLFAVAGAAAAAAAASAAMEPEVELELPDSVDLDIDLGIGEEAAAESLDIDLGLPGGIDEAADEGAEVSAAEADAAVDFDLTLPGGATLDGGELEEPLVHDEGHVLDFDLTSLGGQADEGTSPEVAEEPADNENLVDFDLTLPGGDLLGDGAEPEAVVHDEGHVLDFDLGLDDVTSESAPADPAVGGEADQEAPSEGLDMDLSLLGGGDGGDEGTLILDLGGEESAEEETVSLDLGSGETAAEEAMPLDLGSEEPAEEAAMPLDLGIGGAAEDDAMLLDLGGEESAGDGAMPLDLGAEVPAGDEAMSLDLGADEPAGDEAVSLDLGAEEPAGDEAMALDLGADEPAGDEAMALDLGADEPAGDEAMALDLGADEPAGDEAVSLDLGAEEPAGDAAVSLDLGVEEPAEDDAILLDLGGEEPAGDAVPLLDLGGEEPPEDESPSPDSGGVGEETVSLDLGGGEALAEDSVLDLGGDDGEEVSLDLGLGDTIGEEEGVSLDLGEPGADEAFDLGIDDEAAAPDGGSDGAETMTLDLGDEMDFDLDLGLDAAEGEGGDDALDLGAEPFAGAIDDGQDPVLDLPSAGEAAVTGNPPPGDETLTLDDEVGLPSDVDEVANKLDLARAFIGMGDEEGAKALLEEVMSEGNDAQKRQAQEML